MIYFIFVAAIAIIFSAFFFIRSAKRNLAKLKSDHVVNADTYFRERMESWGSVYGTVGALDVNPRSVFVPGGSVYKYHLQGVVNYSLQGKSYRCELSPYTFFVTSKKETAITLKSLICRAGKVSVFYNPENLDESFFVFENNLSWKDFEISQSGSDMHEKADV